MIRWLFPLQCFLLALALSWPAPARFWSEAVGSIEGDGVKHVWNLWWMRAEALGGTSGLATRLVNFPTGLDLFPIEPLNGLLSLALPFQPVPLSNFLAIFHLCLLGLCAGWLGKLVSERPLGAFVAGALAQGSAFAAFTLHVGVGELRQVWWIPLGLACLVKARTTLERRWFVALALTLAGATLSCFYHGFFLATAVAVYALATLRPWPGLLLGYLLAAGGSLAVVVPVIHSFSASYAPADEGRRPASFSEWMDARYDLDTYKTAALDPVELLRPRDAASADRQALSYTGGRYLGWIALLLAAVGVAASPRKAAPWVVVGAAGLVLSFGTVLWWDGALVGGAERVILPLTPINRALAYFAEPMNFPARFVVVPMLAISVLGALATRWGWTVLLVPLAIVEIAWGDLVPWPRETIRLPLVDAAAVARLELPPGGAIADLTTFTRAESPNHHAQPGASLLSRLDPESRTRAIAAQVVLDRPFSTVPIERIDHWGPEGLYWTSELALARGLGGEQVDDVEVLNAAWLLADAGFVAVLVTHGCQNSPPAVTNVLDRAFGPPYPIGCASLWPVNPATPAPPGADEIKAAHAARVATLAPPQLGPQFPNPSGP